jgi:hypothetical protein
LAEQFQDYVVSDSTLGDDSTTVFYAPSIRIGNFEDSAIEVSALEVYVGGIRQYAESNDGSTLITTPSQYRWNCIDGGGPDYVDNEGNITHNPLTIEFVVEDMPQTHAGSFVMGTEYRITYVGTTNFVAIGAPSNTVGTTFKATGAGSGTGTATTGYPELQAPAEGSEVTILVRQGVTWYQQGATTASDGVSLQDTDTLAARFLRGE